MQENFPINIKQNMNVCVFFLQIKMLDSSSNGTIVFESFVWKKRVSIFIGRFDVWRTFEPDSDQVNSKRCEPERENANSYRGRSIDDSLNVTFHMHSDIHRKYWAEHIFFFSFFSFRTTLRLIFDTETDWNQSIFFSVIIWEKNCLICMFFRPKII